MSSKEEKLNLEGVIKEFGIVDVKEFMKYVQTHTQYGTGCKRISTPESLAKYYNEQIERCGHLE